MGGLSAKKIVTIKGNSKNQSSGRGFLARVRDRAADLYSWASEWQSAVGNVPLVSPEVQKQRLAHCEGGCDKYISREQRCGACSCRVAIKTLTVYDPHTLLLDEKYWKHTECPLKKWGPQTSENA
jgi:hypothetical protein